MSSEEYIIFIPTPGFFYGAFSSLIDKPFDFSCPYNDIIRVSSHGILCGIGSIIASWFIPRPFKLIVIPILAFSLYIQFQRNI